MVYEPEYLAIRPGDTVKFIYIRNAWAAGGTKTAFTADDDAFDLDERLLKLGMIWQWRANKGLPYAEDMANYEAALAMLIGADKGENILRIGGRRSSFPDAKIAYPWSLGQ